MIPVENYNNLYRDPKSKGVVNINSEERKKFLERKKAILSRERELLNKMDELCKRIEYLEKFILENTK